MGGALGAMGGGIGAGPGVIVGSGLGAYLEARIRGRGIRESLVEGAVSAGTDAIGGKVIGLAARSPMGRACVGRLRALAASSISSLPAPGSVPAPATIAKTTSQILINRATGKAAERRLLSITPGGILGHHFATSLGSRFVDVLDPAGNRVAKEVKTGSVGLSKAIRMQIQKDIELLNTLQVGAVEWHFYPNGSGVRHVRAYLTRRAAQPLGRRSSCKRSGANRGSSPVSSPSGSGCV